MRPIMVGATNIAVSTGTLAVSTGAAGLALGAGAVLGTAAIIRHHRNKRNGALRHNRQLARMMRQTGSTGRKPGAGHGTTGTGNRRNGSGRTGTGRGLTGRGNNSRGTARTGNHPVHGRSTGRTRRIGSTIGRGAHRAGRIASRIIPSSARTAIGRASRSTARGIGRGIGRATRMIGRGTNRVARVVGRCAATRGGRAIRLLARAVGKVLMGILGAIGWLITSVVNAIGRLAWGIRRTTQPQPSEWEVYRKAIHVRCTVDDPQRQRPEPTTPVVPAIRPGQLPRELEPVMIRPLIPSRPQPVGVTMNNLPATNGSVMWEILNRAFSEVVATQPRHAKEIRDEAYDLHLIIAAFSAMIAAKADQYNRMNINYEYCQALHKLAAVIASLAPGTQQLAEIFDVVNADLLANLNNPYGHMWNVDNR